LPYDGKFTFVRLRYDNPLGGLGRRSMNAWSHDYNRAELHSGKILGEVSLVPTYLGGGNVLRIEDPELFKYPVAYMVEPGYWRPTTPSDPARHLAPKAGSSSSTTSPATSGQLRDRWPGSFPATGW